MFTILDNIYGTCIARSHICSASWLILPYIRCLHMALFLGQLGKTEASF